MLNMKRMYLFSVSALAVAVSADFTYAGNIDISTASSISTHTSHTALELKPLNSFGYDVAGLTWLPKIKDSEVGPTGNDLGYNANQGKDCSDYKYSTSNCTANNQEPLGKQCLYNYKLFDSCGCNTAKFPISQTECSYSGSVRSQAWLLGNNVCKDQRYSNRMYGKKCLCASSYFPHTSTATCPSPQTLLDDASKCSYQDTTRYERCKCDTAAGKYEFSSDKGEGYFCSKCTDTYGDHYKCEVVPCPIGQETGHKEQDTCNGGKWKATINKSGTQQCYRCDPLTDCSFYKNADGPITIPDGACSWRVYGHYTTTSVPNNDYQDSFVAMWGNSTVNGAFTTNKLAVGGACSSSGYCNKSPRTITFNDLVVVNDVIEYDPFTTMVFKQGVCGNFTCTQFSENRYVETGKITNIKQGVGDCPKAKASGCPQKCNMYYKNANGNISIPNNQCGWRIYGNYATISSGTPKNDRYEDIWINTWGNTTIKKDIKTKKIQLGAARSSWGTEYPQEKNAKIKFEDKIDISDTLYFEASTNFEFISISGDYKCQIFTNDRKLVGNPLEQGEGKCPCSTEKFAHNASTCNGILAGVSCGGKYERCDKIDNCAEYDANRTQCTKCNSGYNLENGLCVEAECSPYYKNSNGSITIPNTACSWRVYGNNGTITVPNKHYSDSFVAMSSDSSVKGSFTTNTLAVGGVCDSSGQCETSPRTITFEDTVVVNDIIEYDPITTIVFKQGVCGNFTCTQFPKNRYVETGKTTNIKQGEGNCPKAKSSGCP